MLVRGAVVHPGCRAASIATNHSNFLLMTIGQLLGFGYYE